MQRRIHRLSTLATVVAFLAAAGAVGAQERLATVAGMVADKQFGGPLPGARVEIVGSDAETLADRSGRYRLSVALEGEQQVRFSYLGFDTRTESVAFTPGSTQTVDVRLALSGFDEEVTVTAPLLEGQAKALMQQQTAPNITNVVAADQIGAFPDPNAAEAVQRVPGISVERDQGEGRYVIVRGTEARLNSMMINGERIPSPEGDVRQVALDVVPADLLQSIEVTKSLTPDMDADSIGGAVNLVTRSVPEQPQLGVVAALGYNDIRGKTLQRGIVSFGRRLNDVTGVSLSASVLNTDRGSDNFEVAYDDGELDELEIRHYTVNRRRIGINGALDFRTKDGGNVTLHGMYNNFRDQEYRRRTRNQVGDERLERELKDRLETQEIISASVTGAHFLAERLKLDYRVGYSYADEDEPDARYSVFRQDDVVFDPNVSPGSIDPDNIQANPRNEDLRRYILNEQSNEDNRTTDRDLVGAVNLTIPFGAGKSFLKLGGKYRDKKKDRDVQVTVYEPEEDIFLSDVLDGDFGNGTPFLDDRYVPGPHVDPDLARSLTARLSGEKSLEDDLADYDATERVVAAYAMAQIHSGDRLMILPGVRLESTSVDATGYELTFNDDGDFESLTPVTTTKSYTSLFPYAHARYRIGDRSNLRAAVTRSTARPSYYDLVPYQLILQEDLEIERGNPSLDPTLSWNYDLLFEHFLDNVGLVSAGVFHKRLSDFIFPFTAEEERGDETYDVVEPRNGEAADLTGLELAFQGRTRVGLGLYGNYTYTTSNAEIPGRDETTALPGQPKHTGNVALTFERSGFSGRAALVFHGEYVYEVGGDAAEDVYKDAHRQVDVALSQRLSRRARLFVEVNNLTNEPLRFYEGSSDRPIQEEYYKWWGTFGIKWSF